MELRVECYSGYRGEETPRHFWLRETLIEIKEVVDRWLDPKHRYFKVVGDDDSTYILRHDSETYVWKSMGVRPTQLTIKQPAFQKFRPDHDLFQNLQNLHKC